MGIFGEKKNTGWFGNPFDFNGDGKTDFLESALAFAMFHEIEKEEERERRAFERDLFGSDDEEDLEDELYDEEDFEDELYDEDEDFYDDI